MEQDHNHQYSYSSFTDWTTFGTPKFLAHTAKSAACLHWQTGWLPRFEINVKMAMAMNHFHSSQDHPKDCFPKQTFGEAPLWNDAYCIKSYNVEPTHLKKNEERPFSSVYSWCYFMLEVVLLVKKTLKRWMVYGYKLADFEILWSYYHSCPPYLYSMVWT